ncbi:hypothetical protein [Poriferisphaera sp. WC338]|uniref:hypothetical protein n=1 Tax=Poriferisphaera sp. WC338 TaxID=3425129 RepID=UPI003D8150A9
MMRSKIVKTTLASLTLLAAVGVGLTAYAERDGGESKTDAEILMKQVKQARLDLQALRRQLGIKTERSSRGERSEGHEGREGREGRGEHREGRERSEGRGERGESHGAREGREGGGEGVGDGAGEEGKARIAKNQKYDGTRKGAHLVIVYDPATQAFKGIVTNTTKKTLKDVRVEVHLSNGTELGPTERMDLKPGKKLPVELAANGEKFSWWTTHPEHGNEEGHGPGSEEGDGEHGAGGEGEGDSRPKEASLRPVYNQLQLLTQEIQSLRYATRRNRD